MIKHLTIFEEDGAVSVDKDVFDQQPDLFMHHMISIMLMHYATYDQTNPDTKYYRDTVHIVYVLLDEFGYTWKGYEEIKEFLLRRCTVAKIANTPA